MYIGTEVVTPAVSVNGCSKEQGFGAVGVWHTLILLPIKILLLNLTITLAVDDAFEIVPRIVLVPSRGEIIL